MKNSIYALVEVKTKTKFYIGQTTRDPQVRLGEHRYGAKTYKAGDELKYLYASSLDACGVAWTLEVLAEIETEKDAFLHDDVEDFYVNLYRNSPLTNMRAGNSEPWFGVDYADVGAMIAAREKCIAEAKIKEAKVKKQAEFDAEKMIFSFEKPYEKFVAPAYRALQKRNNR